MKDPDLQVGGGEGSHPDPEIRGGGGGGTPKNFFSALRIWICHWHTCILTKQVNFWSYFCAALFVFVTAIQSVSVEKP